MPLTRIEDNPDSNAAALGLVERAGSLSHVAKARRRRAMAYQLRSVSSLALGEPNRLALSAIISPTLGAKADL
jgi:hypothetical protein